MVIIAMVIMGRMKSAEVAAASLRGRTRFRLVRLIMACRTVIQGKAGWVKGHGCGKDTCGGPPRQLRQVSGTELTLPFYLLCLCNEGLIN